MLGSSVFLITTDQLNHATATIFVGNNAGVNSSRTYERISAINRLVRSIGSRTTYNHGRIDNFLIPNRSGVENMVAFAIGPASERESAAVERTAISSIQTTCVASTPV